MQLRGHLLGLDFRFGDVILHRQQARFTPRQTVRDFRPGVFEQDCADDAEYDQGVDAEVVPLEGHEIEAPLLLAVPTRSGLVFGRGAFFDGREFGRVPARSRRYRENRSQEN